MSAEFPADFTVWPDDVVILKEGFLHFAAQQSAKSDSTGGGRAWNHLSRRCIADRLIDVGQIEHPMWEKFGGAVPERSPLHFIITPDADIVEEGWREDQVDGLVVRSLKPYALRVREIMNEHQEEDIAQQRLHIARYTGGLVGDKVVSFWEFVCDELLPESQK